MKTIVHFFIISRLILLKMRNISDRSCTQIQNTHCFFNNVYVYNHALYGIKWLGHGACALLAEA